MPLEDEAQGETILMGGMSGMGMGDKKDMDHKAMKKKPLDKMAMDMVPKIKKKPKKPKPK